MSSTPETRTPERETVWRVTLAWPETDPVGRQERVDGLMQTLTRRRIVGLMGPGRPTRAGLAVELVLPVRETQVLTAVEDGRIEPGMDGEEFAWDLHEYTGAVVVNGDPASGDFAVLASEGEIPDADIAEVLEEPLESVLLVDTVRPGAVEEALDRSEMGGWMSEGERTLVAVEDAAADPTMLVMPGGSNGSIALRERAGRVDVLVWGPQEQGAARPTRRRRAAQNYPLLNTHVGARCRPIVVPDMLRPAGSEVSTLLLRLEEDFAPLSENDVESLASVFSPARMDALVRAIDDAPVFGVDPEAGALAPMEDGLMPGEGPDEPVDETPVAHARTRMLLEAFGEDPEWVQLFDGRSPVGGSVRPVGAKPVPERTADAVADQSQGAEAAEAGVSENAGVSESSVSESAAETGSISAEAEGAGPQDQAGAGVAAGKRQQKSRRHGRRSRSAARRSGGFDTQLAKSNGGEQTPGFGEILHGSQKDHDSTEVATDSDYPQPTPAGGTQVAKETQLGRAPRKVKHVVLLVIGLAVIVGAAALWFFTRDVGHMASTWMVTALVVGVCGVGLALLGAALWPRRRGRSGAR